MRARVLLVLTLVAVAMPLLAQRGFSGGVSVCVGANNVLRAVEAAGLSAGNRVWIWTAVQRGRRPETRPRRLTPTARSRTSTPA